MAIYNRSFRAMRGPVRFRRGNPVSATAQVETLARQLANQIIRERERAKARQKLGRIFTTFDPPDDVLPNNVESYFYRTAAGAEIDLLLRFSATEIWAIEIKTGHAPKISKGFHIASEDVGAIRKFVVYGGEDEFPVSNDTTMISLEKLLNQIQEKVRLEKA